MRGNIRIILDDIDEIPSTSQNIAQNDADDMQIEDLELRNRRLDKDRERKRKYRENESQKGRMERLEQDRIRHSIRRENENEEENEQRLQQQMIRQRIRRENELDEERVMRLDQRNLRYRNRLRDEIRLFAAGDHRNVIVNRLGRMNVKCTHCGALHFPEEKIGNKGNSFNNCCHHGKVNLNLIPESNFPVLLKNLFLRIDTRYMNFFDCIRNLNSSVSMAYMNPLRYRYPTLNPDDGDEPAYGQVFIVDTEEALSAMNRANPVINQSLLKNVYELIKDINPFAQAYVMMKEEEDIEKERARLENRPPVEVSLLFDTKTNLDRRLGYNVPRANEVAAVYVPGADGEMPNAKIVVREKGKELRILDNTNQLVSPMTYPLFFPRGTLGWHPDIRQENNIRRVTRLQYVSYSIGVRNEFNPILYGGKLFQQYCVDEYVKIESDRMRWIRGNQKTILADAYKNVDSYLEKRARETGKPLGRKVILPPTVTNSPRYIEKHFQDAMSLVRKFGKPDLFVTMTCNSQWEEIKENLYEGQVPSDRPDIFQNDKQTRMFSEDIEDDLWNSSQKTAQDQAEL
uniref:Helitron helicase-like domain-containing protein n=1 Tax=Meloidogyne javanica TaxID=6303 RepID=A0A915M2W0_MELJA